MCKWYLVQTKPFKEAEAEQRLLDQEFSVYFPRIKVRRRIRGRRIERVEPLFPRYLFVGAVEGEQSLAPVRSTVGVLKIVRFGADYLPLEPSVIEHLRRREDASGYHTLEESVIVPGQTVRLLAGPFEGLTGVFQKELGEERVLVLLDWMGRQAPVRLPAHQVALAR